MLIKVHSNQDKTATLKFERKVLTNLTATSSLLYKFCPVNATRYFLITKVTACFNASYQHTTNTKFTELTTASTVEFI